jgi:hemerythrin-like domain-containing protein
VEATLSCSFLALLRVHRELDEIFLQHQEALVAFDLPLARELFDRHVRELLEHMHDEDEILLPLYRKAGEAPRGPAELFSGEHGKIRKFLRRFDRMLDELARAPSRRGVVEIITEQAKYKSLMEHHDQREREQLYAVLDHAFPDEGERASLLARLGRKSDGGAR